LVGGKDALGVDREGEGPGKIEEKKTRTLEGRIKAGATAWSEGKRRKKTKVKKN